MCVRGRDDLMRNTEGNCPGQRPRLSSSRFVDPMEQTGAMGNRRTVRRDDRQAVSAKPIRSKIASFTDAIF